MRLPLRNNCTTFGCKYYSKLHIKTAYGRWFLFLNLKFNSRYFKKYVCFEISFLKHLNIIASLNVEILHCLRLFVIVLWITVFWLYRNWVATDYSRLRVFYFNSDNLVAHKKVVLSLSVLFVKSQIMVNL